MGISSDRHKYPAGKKRFEPLGVLIFSVAMIASFAQVSVDLSRIDRFVIQAGTKYFGGFGGRREEQRTDEMVCFGTQVFIESFQRAISKDQGEVAELSKVGIA